MQHTLIAVFDNRNDAQSAQTELLGAGFDRSSVRLSEDSSTAGLTGSSDTTAAASDEGFGAGIKHFFLDLFGDDSAPHAHKYSNAITRGHHVLTITAQDDAAVERAADIVERYGPVDIDEKSAEWGSTGTGSDAGALRMGGAGTLQGSQSSASLQSQAQENRDAGYADDASYARGNVQGASLGDSQQRDAGNTAIPVVQEQLNVGKREVQRGGVRVYSRIVETPVNESVSLREEHVNVERRPVDLPLSASDLNAFKEQTIELRETAEEAVVQKSARVVEEVIVGKETTQRDQQIHDTLRHTEVEVEQLGTSGTGSIGGTSATSALNSADDTAWRSHWTSNYGAAGGTYDDYAPAYTYGSQMAGQYRGRPWNDVESDLRTNWESRNAGNGVSTWEKFKGAIRHGWDRVTN